MMMGNNFRWRRWCYCVTRWVAKCWGQTWARRRRMLGGRFRSLVFRAVQHISFVKKQRKGWKGLTYCRCGAPAECWCFGRFVPRPLAVCLPLLLSSPSLPSPVCSLRLLPPRDEDRAILWPFSVGESCAATTSRSSRLSWVGCENGVCEPPLALLVPPMPPTPLPIPENIFPNSLLMPGSPAGPFTSPCTP